MPQRPTSLEPLRGQAFSRACEISLRTQAAALLWSVRGTMGSQPLGHLVTSAFAPIQGGWFSMGTERGQEDERPPHRVFVDAFELGVFPVTRAQYEGFVDATDHQRPRDWSHPPFAQPDLPVVGVSWLDAIAYCAWRSSEHGRPIRL